MNDSITFLGLVAGIEENIRARRGMTGDRVPFLTVADVFGLLDIWSGFLERMHEHFDDELADRVVERWSRVVADALSVAERGGGEAPYPDARRFWSEVRKLAGHFDRALGLASEIGDALRGGFRNAATMSVHGDEVKIDGVKDLVDLWGAMVRHFRETRGSVTDPAKRDTGTLPRTSVGEVLWVADFWTKKIDSIGSKRLDHTDEAIAKYRQLVAHTIARAQGLKEDDVFPENWTFWDQLGDFVIALDEARVAPVPFSFTDSLKHSIEALPGRLESAWGTVTSALGHGVETAEHDVEKGYDAVKDVARDVAGGVSGFFKEFETPLIIGGVALIGLVILIPALSSK